MHILHIITSLKMGGAEAALFYFLQHAVKTEGITHSVAYVYDGPFVEKIRLLGVPVYSVAGWFWHHDSGTYIKLFRLVKHLKPDLLHTSLWSANLLGRLLARHCSLPLLSEVHGDCRKVSSYWKNYLDRLTVSLVKHQRIVAVSAGVKDAYEQTVLRDHLCLQVIKNGIDVKALQERARLQPLQRSDIGLSDNDFVIGAVGRLEPVKSYDVLIKAFVRSWKPDMKLCIVGDGSERRALEVLATKRGVREHIVFLGQRTDAYRLYQLFDCFALSSQTEGLSLALLEALTFGLPIITTHAGEQHEVLIDGRHGLLVPVNDDNRYALAIQKLYNSKALRATMHEANKALIPQFDITHALVSYELLYKELYRDYVQKNT